MNNWTDPIIHWNQLPGTEVKRLIATWGMTPDQIAKYDRKHGFAVTAGAKPHFSNTANPVDFPKPAAKTPKAKAEPKAKATRQRHHGADGEIQFLEHRQLWIGFAGGRVVVTKRTRAACQVVLEEKFGIKPE